MSRRSTKQRRAARRRREDERHYRVIAIMRETRALGSFVNLAYRVRAYGAGRKALEGTCAAP